MMNALSNFFQMIISFFSGDSSQMEGVAMAGVLPAIGGMVFDRPTVKRHRIHYGHARVNSSRDALHRMQRVRKARGQNRRTGA
jgi:hypothetical protein